jgi:multidrug efflux pump subunit AcrA (membrane-fusion protein)
MPHMQKKSINIFISGIVLLTITGCSSATTSTPAAISRQVPVQRGDLVVSVSVDGNLEMTDYYNLRFSGTGEVKQVLVQEGDQVRQGQLLAYLDDTTQRLDVKLANNAVQTSLSTLYETVPRLPQFPGVYYKLYPESDPLKIFAPDRIIYDKSDPPKPIMASEAGVHDNPVYTMYYPNATILSSYGWAQDEVAMAHELFQTDNYSAAASELYVASADLEACIRILGDTINNPESGLGNTAPFVNDSNYVAFSVQNDNSFAAYYIQELRAEVASLRQAQSDIQNVYNLINQAKYEEAKPLLSTALATVDETAREVIENINRLKLRNDTTIYGRDISLYFYDAATARLNEAITGIGKGGLYSPEMNDNLRIARHYIELCNGILGSNDMVLQHGLGLKAEQNAKIDLAGKLVSQDTTQNNYLNTFIWAPIDGTVVSVGLKEKDILSSKNATSTNAIVLVNTRHVEFWGSVDEIDIMKIKVGQRATISVDAVPDKKFTGVVTFISPKGTADANNVVKYSVRIKLDATDVALKGKLTATADIGITTIENALLVPLSAITTTGSVSTVTVVSGDKGGTEKKTVTLGTQNQQYVQVIEGLGDGDTVIIVDKASGAPVSTTMGPPGGGPPPGGGGPPPGR